MTTEFGDRGRSDPFRILATLARHEVDYVVIGGFAVIAHGHTRNTRDIDFVASTDYANLTRLAAALRELGVDIYDPDTLRNGANFTLQTEAGGLDFFNEVPGGVPYEDLRRRALELEVRGVAVRVAGLDDLVRMKLAAGRPRDLDDIRALTQPG